MPLPKAPSRPATMLDIREAAKAKAARPKPARGSSRRPAADLEASPAPDLTAEGAVLPAMARDLPAAPPVPRVGERPRARLLSEPGAGDAGIPEVRSAEVRSAEVPSVQAVPTAAVAPWTPDVASTPRAAVVPLTQGPRSPSRRTQSESQKLFVLDTNVLMHDPSSLFRFQEHDVYLPMMTLEELDNHKRGMSEVSRNARQVSRSLDALIGDGTDRIDQGIVLAKLGNREAVGRLYLQTQALSTALPAALPTGKADNQILAVVSSLREVFPSRQVVLVSKDINMRIK
ncbi:MAG TPA: PIN domain-containing protein, partial [Lautropia sp.]|nr:PIN domain-containing protein [Lautropia sp.]